ncbi:MAG: hypothetical protein RL699_855 [Bacteroidota bacterium]|jgi:hypothetical protein
MYKTILLFLICFSATAQEQPAVKHHEIRTNVLTTLSQGSYNLSIEKKTTGNFSYGLGGSITQSTSQKAAFETGNKSVLPVWDITPFVRYKLSKSMRSYYFAEAFSSLNHGKNKAIIRYTDAANNSIYRIEKGQYTDLALGGSLGYKLLIKQVFALEFLVGFGSNLLDTKQSPDVVSRVGLSVGYQY